MNIINNNVLNKKKSHIYLWGVFMIIIPKKRIIVVTTILCIMLFVCNIVVNQTTENTVETMSLPVTNKVIVIDAGHRSSG